MGAPASPTPSAEEAFSELLQLLASECLVSVDPDAEDESTLQRGERICSTSHRLCSTLFSVGLLMSW